jgi:hypothetical protein
MISDFKTSRKVKLPKPDLSISIDERDNISEDKDPEPTPPISKMRKPSTENKWYKPPYSKKEKWILAGIAAGIIIILLGVLGYLHYHQKKHDSVTVSLKAKVAPVYKSPLTGAVVTQAESQLPVTAVMIENSDGARPQSGLSQAGVVFEALAEGGVTRFMALFEEGQPSSVGPIRSARPYFIDWLLPFNAAYAHVGGSPDALNEISSLGVKNMDEFAYGGSYTRLSSRPAPHNVYTSMSTLLALEKSKGWAATSFTSFARKADSPAKVPTATNINFAMSGPDMAVNYQYAAKTNSYLRSEAGTPMVDANTNQQLNPKVVVDMVIPWSYGPLDATGAYYTAYTDIGSGQAYIFQDGTVTTGSWTKSSQNSQIQFTDSTGKPISLNAGQTWITASGKTSEVTYSH